VTVVAVDTSVYVSALVFGGTPRVAVDLALTVPFRLAVSAELKAELVETLREKFDRPGDLTERSCAVLWERAL
jgi:predicted nucleic acid-binding protein